jgi:hypothetical protein
MLALVVTIRQWPLSRADETIQQVSNTASAQSQLKALAASFACQLRY